MLAVGAPVFRQYPFMPGPLVDPGTRVAVVTDEPAEAHRSPADLAVLAPPAAVCAALVDLVEDRGAFDASRPVRERPAPPRAARAGRADARRPRLRRARRAPARGHGRSSRSRRRAAPSSRCACRRARRSATSAPRWAASASRCPAPPACASRSRPPGRRGRRRRRGALPGAGAVERRPLRRRRAVHRAVERPLRDHGPSRRAPRAVRAVAGFEEVRLSTLAAGPRLPGPPDRGPRRAPRRARRGRARACRRGPSRWCSTSPSRRIRRSTRSGRLRPACPRPRASGTLRSGVGVGRAGARHEPAEAAAQGAARPPRQAPDQHDPRLVAVGVVQQPPAGAAAHVAPHDRDVGRDAVDRLGQQRAAVALELVVERLRARHERHRRRGARDPADDLERGVVLVRETAGSVHQRQIVCRVDGDQHPCDHGGRVPFPPRPPRRGALLMAERYRGSPRNVEIRVRSASRRRTRSPDASRAPSSIHSAIERAANSEPRWPKPPAWRANSRRTTSWWAGGTARATVVDPLPEAVADAARGRDLGLGGDGPQLAPQARDVLVERVVVDDRALGPRRADEVAAGDDRARLGGER